MTKDVLVVAQYAGTGQNSNNRFREICKRFSQEGMNVELVTSSFMHASKRPLSPGSETESGFKVTRIHEPGYRKNLSVSRILSHQRLARNVVRYLESRKVPDVIYCALPSLSLATKVLEFARENNVRIIIDVQDLWPEAFEMVIKPRPFAKAILSPLSWQANRIYAKADAVVTVSETYAQRIVRSREQANSPIVVYLGTDLEKFDSLTSNQIATGTGPVKLVYIGTLGHSYDLPLVFESLRHLKSKGIPLEFHIMGSGPLEKKWKYESQDLSDIVTFHGRLAYPEMVARLQACDIAVNPIVSKSAGSVINKVCDYAAAGLPVVNTQQSVEYIGLLSRYKAGIHCDQEPAEVAAAIEQLVADSQLRFEFGAGSRRLAEEKFDRSVTYSKISRLLQNQ